MKILRIKNLTKELEQKNVHYDAQVKTSKFTKQEFISQDEFNRITNNLLKGTRCFIKGREIKPTLSPYSTIAYEPVYTNNPKNLPNNEVFKKFRNVDTSKLLREERIAFFKELNKVVESYNESIKTQVEQHIARRTKYIQNLDVRNVFFKDIFNTALDVHIKAYSPCAKTEPEVQAQRQFMDLIPTDEDITDEQIAYVECNARKFGLEIPKVEFYHASREVFQEYVDSSGNKYTKSHGYTEEIYPVIASRPNYFESHCGVASEKNYKGAFHPDNTPEEWMVQSAETTKGQYKEIYKQLKYIENLDPETRDFFIADGYCRCPHCGEITKKINNHNVDIRCEYCDGILEELVCVSNDYLLYGTDIDNAYSDLEDVAEYLNSQGDEDDE